MTKYFKGDDFDSFNQEWAEVVVDIPADWIVSKVELKIGNLPVMTFTDPIFPFPISLNASQTAGLKDVNTCYMALYDEYGRKQTCEGSWTFVAEDKVV